MHTGHILLQFQQVHSLSTSKLSDKNLLCDGDSLLLGIPHESNFLFSFPSKVLWLSETQSQVIEGERKRFLK